MLGVRGAYNYYSKWRDVDDAAAQLPQGVGAGGSRL